MAREIGSQSHKKHLFHPPPKNISPSLGGIGQAGEGKGLVPKCIHACAYRHVYTDVCTCMYNMCIYI